jgi:hypothetical protein
MRECLKKTGECKEMSYALYVCMRGQLDTRGRIQGFKGTGESIVGQPPEA